MCVFQLIVAVTGHWQAHKHIILSILSMATGTFLDFYLKKLLHAHTVLLIFLWPKQSQHK